MVGINAKKINNKNKWLKRLVLKNKIKISKWKEGKQINTVGSIGPTRKSHNALGANEKKAPQQATPTISCTTSE